VKSAHSDGIESTSLDPRGRQRNKIQNVTPAKDEIREIGNSREEKSDDQLNVRKNPKNCEKCVSKPPKERSSGLEPEQLPHVVIFRLVWDFGGRLFDLFLEPFLGAKKSPFFNPQSSTKPTGKLPTTCDLYNGTSSLRVV
jgi:hypothetical protein